MRPEADERCQNILRNLGATATHVALIQLEFDTGVADRVLPAEPLGKTISRATIRVVEPHTP